MRLTGSRVALVGAVCGMAMVGTIIGQAEQAQGQGQGQGGAAVQAPAAPGQGAGRAGGRGGRGGGRGGGGGGARGPQTQVANVVDVQQMIAALPSAAPATPCHQLPLNAPERANLVNCAADRGTQTPRRVLVLARAGGFVHSSIPLAARTIEALGNKTGAWTTVITYDAADITAENLANYDAIFLASTTGAFLDDPNDQAATDARRKAFMDFVKGGKGLAGIHAATDSYRQGINPTWEEFNQAIGGWFKFHWNNGTQVQIKVDSPDNPINAPFTRVNQETGQREGINRLRVQDEIYTFPMNAWDRNRVRVLTSIDYDAMPAEVKAQEPENNRRTDGDYALSYIQRVGNGRVFVQLLGHDESHYKIPSMLEHLLAGMQYALGDLKADDSPSGK